MIESPKKGVKKDVLTNTDWMIREMSPKENGIVFVNAYNKKTHELMWFDVTKSYLKRVATNLKVYEDFDIFKNYE